MSQLDNEAKKYYYSKLEMMEKSYLTLTASKKLDFAEKSPDMEYGDIYNYLIDLPGPYTKEKHKSLEAYNFYFSGHV